MLPEIVDRAGPLSAVSAQDEETLEPAKIYVAPPDRHLLVGEDGRLRLSRGPKENLARPAVDPLFRSAALVFGPRLIGVVLIGYLDDGTAGLQAIKLCGGAAIVQDPKEALAPGMPSSVLKNVRVDYCLPLMASLAENTETAFWSAMRCLQEEAILKRHMATHSIADSADAEALLNDADEAMATAGRVRIIQENYVRREPQRDG